MSNARKKKKKAGESSWRRAALAPSGPTGWMVARDLRLSPMTVSMVMNGQHGPSAETVERVRAYAAKIGYQVNGSARTLALRRHGRMRSGLVGVLLQGGDTRLEALAREIQAAGLVPFVLIDLSPNEALKHCQRLQPDVVINLLGDTTKLRGAWMTLPEPGKKAGNILRDVPAVLERLRMKWE